MTVRTGASRRSASSHLRRTSGSQRRGSQHAQAVSGTQRRTQRRATLGEKSNAKRMKQKADALSEEQREGRRGKKTGRYKTPQERWREQLMRKRDLLEEGLGLSSCRLFLTLVKTRIRADGTKGRDYHHDHRIRSEIWHLVWSEVKKPHRWPQAQMYTVMEYACTTGVHLHVVVRDAPGLTAAWISRVIAGRYPDFEVDTRDVWDGHGLAGYLTKTLNDPEARRNWGRYTHVTSKSHGWLPKA